MSPDASHLSIHSLSKDFANKRVLDKISFEVGRGEFVSLLGPSGCGKSTTLMIIAGFEHPDAGDVRLDGKQLAGIAPEARNMGIVFQNYALFPHMSALENVMFPLLMRGVSRPKARASAQDTLRMVRIDDPEASTARLSGGQRQRVALARALVYIPDLLLMDEPLSALDRNLRAEMQFELRRIQRELGATVVCVTHDQEEALAMSDRVLVMEGGQIHQDAPPIQIYQSPATEFVAKFIGESNLIAGEVSKQMHPVAQFTCHENPNLRVWVPAGPSGPATLVVRPEHVSVIARGTVAARQGINAIPAVVTSTTFLGTRLRVEARAEALGTWFASVPIDMVDSTVTDIIRVGREIDLVWDSANAHLISRKQPGDSAPSVDDSARQVGPPALSVGLEL